MSSQSRADDVSTLGPYISDEAYASALSRWQESPPDHRSQYRELLLASRNVYRPGQKQLTSLEAVQNLNGMFAAACETGFRPTAEEFLGLWMRSIDNVDSKMAKAVSEIEEDDNYQGQFFFWGGRWSRDAATLPSNMIFAVYDSHCGGDWDALIGPNGTNLADVYLTLLLDDDFIDQPNAHASLAFFQTTGIHPTLRNPEGGENHILMDRFDEAGTILGWVRGMTGDDFYTPETYQDYYGNSLAHYVFFAGPGYAFQQRYRHATQRLRANFDLVNRDGFTAQGIIDSSPAYQQGVQNVYQEIAAERAAERQRRMIEAQREADRRAQQDRMIAAAMGLVIQSYGTSQMLQAGADPTHATNFGRSVAFDAVSQIDPHVAESFRPVYTPPPRVSVSGQTGDTPTNEETSRTASDDTQMLAAADEGRPPEPLQCYYTWGWRGEYYTDTDFNNERYAYIHSSTFALERGFVPSRAWLDSMRVAAQREGEATKWLFEQQKAAVDICAHQGRDTLCPWRNEQAWVLGACNRPPTTAEMGKKGDPAFASYNDGSSVDAHKARVAELLRQAESFNDDPNDRVSSSIRRSIKDLSKYN